VRRILREIPAPQKPLDSQRFEQGRVAEPA
jgi:hypothetical protein